MNVRGGLVAFVLLLAWAPVADAALYRTSIRGSQELTWTVDGTTGGCEIRRGTGDGTVRFTFRSVKPQLLNAGRDGLQGSLPSVATGSITGRFTDAVETPCPDQEPGEPFVAPADGCGATRFGLRVDATPRGAFTYFTGPVTPLGPASTAQAGGECPFPVDLPVLESTDMGACGDGDQLWQRSWGVSASRGEGLLASRVQIGAKRLPRKGRSRQLTGRAAVECTLPSQYTGGVALRGALTYTLTVKRTR